MAAFTVLGIGEAGAQNIVDSWKTVSAPVPPQLQPATVDSAHTALLILDMYARTCIESERPRCVPTIPHVQHLLTEARAHKMKIVYSGSPPSSTASNDPVDPLKPVPGEALVRGGADKFLGSDLEKILTDGGIRTVIVVGTSADGAVLYTGSHAAMLNMNVVVPIDGISSVKAFSELYTVWHLKNTASPVSGKVTLTKADMITMK
jgi:nicotinamidase-related amidase